MASDPITNSGHELLAAIPYFSALDTTLLQLLAGYMKRQEYSAGQIVFLEGEEDVALYIVETGWVKAVKYSPDGREQILQFIGSGEVFNAIGVLIERVNPATIITLEATIVWSIEQQVILQIIDENPQVGRIIIQHLAKRVQQLVLMVEDFSLRTIESRLARYLTDYSENQLLKRPRWATQAEMANRIGTVPDVLNRVLRSFVRDQLIEVDRHEIRILDAVGLQAKADLDK